MQPPETIGALAILVLVRNAAAFDEHLPGAREGQDPVHVHQMRVATRRIRAALRLFGDVLPADASSLNDELNWIAGQLGAARDLDVQVRRLRDTAAELGLSDALVPYGAWPAETSLALGRVVQRDVQRANQIRKEFARLYRAVRDEGWRRLRRSLE